MWRAHSINSYLNSSTRNKWKTVVHTAWTHNCNFRSPEQCVEMLLKHFFVCYPFCGKFLCCIFQANVAVERRREYLEKISSISLILVGWPFCCMEAARWWSQESWLTYVHEPFGLAGFLSHIWGTVWPSPWSRKSLTHSNCPWCS